MKKAIFLSLLAILVVSSNVVMASPSDASTWKKDPAKISIQAAVVQSAVNVVDDVSTGQLSSQVQCSTGNPVIVDQGNLNYATPANVCQEPEEICDVVVFLKTDQTTILSGGAVTDKTIAQQNCISLTAVNSKDVKAATTVMPGGAPEDDIALNSATNNSSEVMVTNEQDLNGFEKLE